jgi:hypothetical protein
VKKITLIACAGIAFSSSVFADQRTLFAERLQGALT